MKKFLFLAVSALSLAGNIHANDQKRYDSYERWMNPYVTRVNTLAPRASFFAYESEKLAATDDKSLSSRHMSLEGLWKFHFVKHHYDAPKNFHAVGYDDTDWVQFPVPGLFELNGYGDIIYKNI